MTRRRTFGTSWWGRAWVDALEGRARLDPNRLPRGRTYARRGTVGELRLAAGEITADVQGSRSRPYQVRVRVRVLDDAEWGRVLDTLGAEIGHLAALLDGELPPRVADDVRALGLDLLPGPGDLQPRCSCPDWADPCKHAAAVCYLVADALDVDPFGLLALRGRDRGEILAALRSRRRPAAALSPPAEEHVVDPGVRARDAWARTARPLPAATAPPRHPGHLGVLGADPPTGSSIDVARLQALAADAALRALELVRGARHTGLELTHDQDLARRAANALGDSNELRSMARHAGVTPRHLLHSALAWRDGGPAGLAAVTDTWDPEPEALEPGRTLLGPGATIRRNRVTLGAGQVRLGPDLRWYPFRKDRAGGWYPDGSPVDAEPDDLDAGAG